MVIAIDINDVIWYNMFQFRHIYLIIGLKKFISTYDGGDIVPKMILNKFIIKNKVL